MSTYNTSAYNKLRSPSGAVGEPPDGPGGIAALRDDVDNYLGIGGAEYCATTAARDAIPSTRLFRAKLAYVAAGSTGGNVVYRYDPTYGWNPWESVPQNYTPTFSNMTLGNGSIGGSYWWSSGVLHASIAITIGSTTTFSASPLIWFPQAGADTSYQHCGTAVINRSTSSRPGLFAVLDNNTRFALWQPGGGQFTSTSPLTLQSGDVVSIAVVVKYA